MFRNSRPVKTGGFDHIEAVTLGGDSPVVIQTMWKDRLSFSNLEGKAGEALVSRIEVLKKMGCGLLRFAVPDLESAEILGNLASMVSIPLVADIHFDYKIALRCLDFPIAKIRINPGNIGSRDKVKAVLSKAAAKARPIRIGVNSGSLPQDLRRQVDQGSLENAEALVLAAEREMAIFDEFNFTEAAVSMKASSIGDTMKANRMLAGRSDIPLHIGVTEAGPLVAGVARSTAALVSLLAEGIGDTVRVSLSDSMENEVIAAREILGAAADMAADEAASRLRRPGISIVSCPRCSRYSFDTHAFTERWQSRFYAMDKNITVAVMGCEVNGLQEARHADLGITGAGGKVIIFRRGKPIRTITDSSKADEAFLEELKKL